ncbi:MAG: 4Fe-4S double cluster binding domain-containing protein [Candidatus Heimdallarchaeota archaeon]
MVATRAGLGWIGKNALLITPEYGPRVRLVSILMDAPLKPDLPTNKSSCGKCRSCVSACPVKALKGASWTPKNQRDDLILIDRCREVVHRNKELVGSNVCGVCISACPIGKKPQKEN